MQYGHLQAALGELGISGQATAQQVRDRYRELVKLYHPDSGAEADNPQIRRVNEAYNVVSAYLQNYVYDFSKDKFYQQYPEERLREQFYDADLWGGNAE